MTINEIETPSYVIDEKKLIDNLKILESVEKRSGCHILLAQKAFSAFSTYGLISRYISGTCASGLYEAKLGYEEMGKENHVFSPAYKKEEMDELVKISDHIIFNSITQLKQFSDKCVRNDIKIGLRINPECSTQEHGIYDPCGRFSRLGVTRRELDKATVVSDGEDHSDNVPGVSSDIPALPEYVTGLHFHTLCEQNADALETTLKAVEEKFGDILSLPQIKWLNMGGGHHITREDYDRDKLVELICRMREKYNVDIIIEPGEAVALNAGYLITEIMDIVYNEIPILILDASAACHMPDVLEMPYTPPLKGAKIADAAKLHMLKTGYGDLGTENEEFAAEKKAEERIDGKKDRNAGNHSEYVCRLSSRTCLAGDLIGDYAFDHMPVIGERLCFEDMAIYSMVKNNTFNGMPLPSIYIMHEDGECEPVRRFSYNDFKERLS